MLLMMALRISVMPFCHGDSAAAERTWVFSKFAILQSNSINSPPLSLITFLGQPKSATQCLKILSIISSFSLDLMTAVALNLVS